MYAIIVDGSRQLKVQEGQELEIDFRNLGAGQQVKFDRVLALGQDAGPNKDAVLKLGAPALAGASVTAEVIGGGQGPKLVVQKMRRRKNSRRKTGHRQLVTRVKISKITAG
jgi:large subunit ribosomal protein L21